ncbi:hypothetical protein QUF72_10190 [Desulfobacterales bacterium HSG2]|nr:hypothetical protein [Desulfobacterales bacterium HSG2]
MISSVLMLCGEGVIRDCETNHVSVFNILEQISSQTFPMLISKIAVLNILSKDDEDMDETTLFLRFACNKNELMKLPIRVKFGGKERTRSIYQIDGLVIPEPGKFGFQLLDKEDRMIAQYDINVNITQDVTIKEIGKPEEDQ